MTTLKRADAFAQLAADPKYISYPLSWIGHIPFAAWLVGTLMPRTLVELGSYSGTSYFAFCQAVKLAGSATQCFAVDTWEGDDHTGNYGSEVFERFTSYNNEQYSEFSKPLRMYFSEALGQFEARQVDLLHIDGLHTYDAVKEDFETWLPKLSTKGVILFHDIAVTTGDFGVYQLWAELKDRYPSHTFEHSNGLGVLLVGSDYLQDRTLIEAIDAAAPLTERLAERLWLQQIARQREAENETLASELAQVKSALDQQTHLLSEANSELAQIKATRLWKIGRKLFPGPN